MAGLAGFLTTVSFNAFVAVLVVVVFCFIRQGYPRVFSPRQLIVGKRFAPALQPGRLSWIQSPLRLDLQTALQEIGPDGTIYLAFLKFGFVFFCYMCATGFVLALPFNCAGENPEGDDDLEFISLSHISNESELLWGHVIAVYVISGIGCYLLLREYQSYTQFRISYMQQHSEESKWVLVTNIPPNCREERKFNAFWQKCYGEDTVSTMLVPITKELDDVVAKRKRLELKLSGARQAWVKAQGGNSAYSVASTSEDVRHQRGNRPEHRPSCVPCVGEKVDTIEWCEERLAEVKVQEAEVRKSTFPLSSSGFVQFRTLRAAKTACTALNSSLPFAWKTLAAPQYADVCWKSITLTQRQLLVRQMTGTVITFGLVFFSSIPIAFLSALTNLENLVDQFDFLGPIVDYSDIVKGLLEFLPTLVLIILMSFLPKIMAAISYYQGSSSHSEAEKMQMAKLFVFQVFNVFLIFTLSGAFFSTLNEISDEPKKIVEILGTNLPEVSTTYVMFVMIQTFVSLPLQLLRLGPFIMSFILKRKQEISDEEFAANNKMPFPYGQEYAKHLLVIMLGITYSTIAPLILPFCVMYFVIAYVTHNHQLRYVYVSDWEGGGRMFPLIFNRVISAFILSQLTLIGVVGIKEGVEQAPFLLPLPLITLLVYRYATQAYRARASVLAVEDAVASDTGQVQLLRDSQIFHPSDVVGSRDSAVTANAGQKDTEMSPRTQSQSDIELEVGQPHSLQADADATSSHSGDGQQKRQQQDRYLPPNIASTLQPQSQAVA